MYNKDKLGFWSTIAISGLLLLVVLLMLVISFGLTIKPNFYQIAAVVLSILALAIIQFIAALQKRVMRLEQLQAQPYPITDLTGQNIIFYSSFLIGMLGYFFLNFWLSSIGLLVFAICLVQTLSQLHLRITQLEQQTPVEKQRHVVATDLPRQQGEPALATQVAEPKAPEWMQQPLAQDQVGVEDLVQPNVSPMQASARMTFPSWVQKTLHWFQHGNPILRIAVLVLLVGVILLLRFASEHWQLSLGIKLLFVAMAGVGLTGLGYYLTKRNALFAVSLQGLGLAIKFLTLVFAHHYAVVADLTLAGFLFVLLLLLTTFLSLKQQNLSLAILALGMAYLAPLLIPQTHPDALFLLSYYLLVNIAVAIVNFIQPWRILNHIAFFASMLIGGIMMGLYLQQAQKVWLDVILWCHIILFIWLSVRYSQLMSGLQQKLTRWQPVLDVSLIFSVPVVGFSLHAFLMHDSKFAMASGAAGLALIYSVLMLWIRHKQPVLSLLSKSFFILAVAFTALIFPLAQGAHWSSIGWVVQGTALLVWGSSERERLSLYSGVVLLLFSSITLFYQVWNEPQFPLLSTSIYSFCQFVTVFYLLQAGQDAERSFTATSLSCIFLPLGLYAGAISGLELFSWKAQGFSPYLMIATVLFALLYAVMQKQVKISWIFLQLWVHSLLLLFFVSELAYQQVWTNFGWKHPFAQICFLLATALNSLLLIRSLLLPKHTWAMIWTASLLWLMLAFVGLAVLPENPVIALSLIPLLYGGWEIKTAKFQLLQQPAVWLLTALWLIVANLDLHAASSGYVFPLLNLTDLMTLSMTLGMLIMIYRHHFDQDRLAWGFKFTALIISLFVLSSALLRGLHHYLQTPLWSSAVWNHGTVQLSFTLLWILLAFLLMTFASRKTLREIWFVGAGLLGLVVVKLVLLDFAQSATLTRVISFIGAGGVMLVIAYLAPLPPPVSREPKA